MSMNTLQSALRKLGSRVGLRSPNGEKEDHAVVAGGYMHERTPPPEWVAQLREHSPLTDAHGTLDLVWEPGDPWTPGQRWLLYEMIAPEQASFELVQALKGPNPRSMGHMCSSRTVPGQFACLCKRKLEGWRDADGNPSVISHTQWRLYRQTGRIGRPFWVIQGRRGGHKFQFTSEEKRFLEAAGKSTQLPGVGELPYAEFDQQVIAHVVRFNRLRRMAIDLKEFKLRMGKKHKLHQKQVERELRRDLIQWFDEQMQPECELFVDAARKGELDDHAPKSSVNYDKLGGDEGVAQYIETGNFPSPVNT